MELDDVNGRGPERISFLNPSLTGTPEVPGLYSIGVHYFSDSDLGASSALLSVYFGSDLVFVDERELTTGQFWEVAQVEWTGAEQRVIEVDQLYDMRPTGED